MRVMKGLVLLVAANALVFTMLNLSFRFLAEFVLPSFGIDIRDSFDPSMLLWAVVIGFSGAFISLMLSKWLAKRAYRMQQVITPSTPKEKLVFETVQALAEREGIKMPEVWVYWDDVPNAFATGPTRNNAMVAVSSGLAMNMTDQELQAVLAHEVGHIANGDMMTTTLLQGLMNTLVYFVANMAARAIASAVSRDAQSSHGIYIAVYLVLQMLLSILAMVVVLWHSRRREFSADSYAADAVGAQSMVSALSKLQALSHPEEAPSGLTTEDALATMKISGGFGGLFSTHPPIEARIAALRNRG